MAHSTRYLEGGIDFPPGGSNGDVLTLENGEAVWLPASGGDFDPAYITVPLKFAESPDPVDISLRRASIDGVISLHIGDSGDATDAPGCYIDRDGNIVAGDPHNVGAYSFISSAGQITSIVATSLVDNFDGWVVGDSGPWYAVRKGIGISMKEIAEPGTPAADQVFIYPKDVGGKTALFAKFHTGATQQIVIEP